MTPTSILRALLLILLTTVGLFLLLSEPATLLALLLKIPGIGLLILSGRLFARWIHTDPLIARYWRFCNDNPQ